jgi:hypothetical protein
MTKRLITLLAALLVLGFVAAGCGDDESDSAGNGDATSAQTVTDTDADTVTEDETVTDDVTETDTTTDADTVTEEQTETAEGGGAAAPAPPARTKENCEKGINSAKQLDADVKEKLSSLCEKATSDDPDDVAEAAQEFCKTMVDNMYSQGGADTPQGAPSRDEALEQCEQAGQQAADQAGGN